MLYPCGVNGKELHLVYKCKLFCIVACLISLRFILALIVLICSHGSNKKQKRKGVIKMEKLLRAVSKVADAENNGHAVVGFMSIDGRDFVVLDNGDILEY